MICLLLIMTIIFINSTESTEQRVRHSDTLLKEEDMTAKAKIWLLMVESGRVDQEELRKITPKSIFIAPLLNSRSRKCKEGYRHDHLGQCVKVIKIDPKVQLELLLQRLNKLYGEKKEEKEEEEEGEKKKEEETESSNGPLHFSLPISNINEKMNDTTDSEIEQVSNVSVNHTTPKVEITTEFIPVPLPMILMNQTNQNKEMESSGAEPLNDTETYETTPIEGSGDKPVESGDGFQEEETTTAFPVSLISEETDYLDMIDTESTTIEQDLSTTKPPAEDYTTTMSSVEVPVAEESYQNITEVSTENETTTVLPKEKNQTEITVKNNSDKIYFPSDDDSDDGLRTLVSSSVQSSRIRFPDEVPQPQIPSYHSLSDMNFKPNKYQVHSSAIPREQFWWLPKNWQINENQQNSALVKVWSRLPLIHDISYSQETQDSFSKHASLDSSQSQVYNYQPRDEGFSVSPTQQQPTTRVVKPFRDSRFQDIILTQRQNFRFQR